MSAHPLLRVAPESEGISSTALLRFVNALEATVHDMHSFMLLRRGQVVAEAWWHPYASDHPHVLFSLSKSFTSTAIGLAVAEDRLTLDDPVLSFFPHEAPAQPNEHLAAMRVRHLLSMSTGHAVDTTDALWQDRSGDWARAFLAQPVDYAPGTHFLYNSGASYMLSAIIGRLTGQTLLDYLRPRLLTPLGITGGTWESCPRGVNTGGWGLSLRTEEIARFGQLYLQRGVWAGQRLLPENWIAEASARQIENGRNPESDWEQGYGYQFWRCRHGAYRGDGAFGQFCVVLPEQEAVFVATAGVQEMQPALNLLWEHLLPAFGPAPLPADPAAQGALKTRLAALILPLPPGRNSSPTAARVTGRTFRFARNRGGMKALRLDFEPEAARLTLHTRQGEQTVVCGCGEWVPGVAALDDEGPQPAAVSGAWADPETYLVKICFYETPFISTLRCRFTAGKLHFSQSVNVTFAPNEGTPIIGRAAS